MEIYKTHPSTWEDTSPFMGVILGIGPPLIGLEKEFLFFAKFHNLDEDLKTMAWEYGFDKLIKEYNNEPLEGYLRKKVTSEQGVGCNP